MTECIIAVCAVIVVGLKCLLEYLRQRRNGE